MKIIFCFLLAMPLLAPAQTGRSISGPPTLSHPSYPTSGQLRHRSNDMTGEDMSNSTKMGSDVDPRVPNENPMAGRDQRPETQTGPYRDRAIYHPEEGPDGIEAQEAAEDGFQKEEP